MKFKIGDKVKVVRKVETHSFDGMGEGIEWGNSWTSKMNDSIGKTFIIRSYYPQGGYSFVGDINEYPEAALELCEDVAVSTLELVQNKVKDITDKKHDLYVSIFGSFYEVMFNEAPFYCKNVDELLEALTNIENLVKFKSP